MNVTTEAENDGYMTGQLLIAMPGIGDDRFERSVIYLCAHSAEGAMGLIVNKLAEEIEFDELLEQLDVETDMPPPYLDIHVGGPVESGRGFVLHTSDYQQETTLQVTEEIGMTATVDILRSIAEGAGPDHCLLALGYAGWAPGQLDSEIQSNGWLSVSADVSLIFDNDHKNKWERAVRKVGIDPSFLSSDAGHA